MTSPTPNSGAVRTPGPWRYTAGRKNDDMATGVAGEISGGEQDFCIACVWNDVEELRVAAEANAAFIVTACNNYDALRAERDGLVEKNEAQYAAIASLTAAAASLRERVEKLEAMLRQVYSIRERQPAQLVADIYDLLFTPATNATNATNAKERT